MKNNWQKRANFDITQRRCARHYIVCLADAKLLKIKNGKIKEQFLKMAGWNLMYHCISYIYFNKTRSHKVNVEDEK